MKNDDYLMSKDGTVDPKIAELEAALAPLRYKEQSFSLPATPIAAAPKKRPVARVLWVLPVAAALAAAVLLYLRADARPSFAVTRETGRPMVAGATMGANAKLREGSWLETDEGSSAEIAVATIGKVHVSPGSKVQLVRTGTNEHRLALERGRIDAVVSAPPRLFIVDTPATTVVDLGCAYHVTVRADGATELHVDSGQVSLEGAHGGAVPSVGAWVPAGADCVTRKGRGPGTPVWSDSAKAFRDALDDFDRGTGKLSAVLALADTPETLSLWHLLQRVSGDERTQVADRIEALVPIVRVTPQVRTSLDPKALAELREELAQIW
jgi:hypothetical protein